MEDYGITLSYEKDKCSICGKLKDVRYVYGKEESKIVKICDDCVKKFKDKTIKELVQKYGKKTNRKDIEILTKSQLLRGLR